MKLIRLVAFMTIVAGIIGWVITFSADPYSSPIATAWQITLIANPIGIILSIILIVKKVKYSTILLILNFLFTISVFPMWFLTDLINMLTGNLSH
ncbi:hypothetical protein [Neobacillus vireti]|uniref:hypothetical protein n=1 Tax=Neobacillus vireti TaxID=220686 RepID=UPI002FFE859D